MADSNQYSPIIKGIFIAEMLIGVVTVIAFLWTGKGIALIHGRGVFIVDRADAPYLYWGGLIVIMGAFVALPLWYLHKGPPKR
ncbi:hypothetical protein [Mesorhizobium sp.]|uniref:hypothetical protein n=1 Tax=Mesorhizobium sp. TaxID=1871066 RepID=UPI000FE49C42|nr:hypothetical protein [Mesorhizobium sp.]RWM40295.1 MAG: hypothetical protein EOR75_10600 [Mesorhizobium sp.]